MTAASAGSGREPRPPGLGSHRERQPANLRRNAPSSTVWIVGGAGDRRGRRLELAALGQDLDATLCVLETGVTKTREMDAAFVQRKRLLERQVSFLEPLHDRVELGDRSLEVLDRGVRHSKLSTTVAASLRLGVPNFAIQLAARKRDADRVARRHLGC